MSPLPDVGSAQRPLSGTPAGEAGPGMPPVWSRRRQDVAIVLWPSFLWACVATMFFFAAFDPVQLGAGTPLEPLLRDREGGYALGFFAFWILTAGSSALTLYLARTQRPHLPPGSGARP